MYRFLVVTVVFTLGGCAGDQFASLPTASNALQATEGGPRGASEPAVASAPLGEVQSVDVSELESPVCEQRKRPGSRIAERICYTEEAYAARTQLKQERGQEYAEALQRDQYNREIRQQMEEERRRQSSGVAR